MKVRLAIALFFILLASDANCETKQFAVNASKPVAEWTHFWERCVGSGHAALALRADYQQQLTKAQADLGFQQVRFHGLFVDDMSVVLPSDSGSSRHL
jgi:xylan 1,4-beta-xylosidase